MSAIYLSNPNCVTPLAPDLAQTYAKLEQGKSAIQLIDNPLLLPHPFFAAMFDDALEIFHNAEYQDFTKFERLILHTLAKTIIDKELPKQEDTLLIIATTKGNIKNVQQSNNTTDDKTYLTESAKKIAAYYHFINKPIIVSNACISGVLAISMAKRLIQAGQYKYVFVVGADEVSKFIVSGFDSFQALGKSACKPYSKNRDGVSLGEASASLLVSSNVSTAYKFEVLGESSINDANHISGPSRTGEGLYQSIQRALSEAKLPPTAIQFISAHGTATQFNDEMEAIAFSRSALSKVPLNSLKAYFGHTLGAAGLLEMVISMMMVKQNQLLSSKGFNELGVSFPLHIIMENTTQKTNYFLKTASGFGGTNAAMVVQYHSYDE